MLGLVLEGGGAKGAYQIGSYFALKELGYKFDAVVGTSIGAINGAMIAMGEANVAMEAWRNTGFSDYYDSKEVAQIVSEKQTNNMFHSFKKLIDNLNSKRISIEPLRNFVYQYIDEDKVRNSKMKFGLVTINLTDRVVEEKFVEDIPKGQLRDYIIASCYLPIFKRELINGKSYLDGGFANQIPYNMVERLGMRPVIIRANPNDFRNMIMPSDAIVIAPSEKYVETMDFNPNKSDELIRIGYFDTYKKFKGFLGKKYYVKPFDEVEADKLLRELYFEKVKEYSNLQFESEYRKFYEEFIPSIAVSLKLESNYKYSEVLTGLFEYFANKHNIDYLKIYDIQQLGTILKARGDFEKLPEELLSVFNIKILMNKVLRWS